MTQYTVSSVNKSWTRHRRLSMAIKEVAARLVAGGDAEIQIDRKDVGTIYSYDGLDGSFIAARMGSEEEAKLWNKELADAIHAAKVKRGRSRRLAPINLGRVVVDDSDNELGLPI